MKEHARQNLQDAFVGDPDPLSEGVNSDPDAPVAVEFVVASGMLRAQAPAGVKTEDVLGPDRFYDVDLTLEDGTRVAITIAQGASGVSVLVNAVATPGLSGIGASDPTPAAGA